MSEGERAIVDALNGYDVLSAREILMNLTHAGLFHLEVLVDELIDIGHILTVDGVSVEFERDPTR